MVHNDHQEKIISWALVNRLQSTSILDGVLASMQNVSLEEARYIEGRFTEFKAQAAAHPNLKLPDNLALQWEPPLPKQDGPAFNPGEEPPVRH